MSKCHTGSIPIGEWRVIDKGSTTIPDASDVTLSTFTRNAGECVQLYAFLKTAGTGDDWGEAFVPGPDGDSAQFYWAAPAANQQALHCVNKGVGHSLDIDWCIVGVVPP